MRKKKLVNGMRKKEVVTGENNNITNKYYFYFFLQNLHDKIEVTYILGTCMHSKNKIGITFIHEHMVSFSFVVKGLMYILFVYC